MFVLGKPATPICYPCYDCYCMFTDKAKLREHENSSHPCSLCNAGKKQLI